MTSVETMLQAVKAGFWLSSLEVELSKVLRHPAPLDVDESEEDPKDFDPAETFGYAIAATISANTNGESLILFFSW